MSPLPPLERLQRSLRLAAGCALLAMPPHGGALAAADRDVSLLVADQPAPAGGDVNATALVEDRSGSGTDTTQRSGSVDASLVLSPAWNVLASLGGYRLGIEPGVVLADESDPCTHLGYGEFEVVPRWFSAAGTVIGCDLDLTYADGARSFAWNRCDGTVVLFVHPHAQATSSWIVELIGTTQPDVRLPAVFPGLAYCHLEHDLQWSLGLPFSSLHWTPTPSWTVSGQLADDSIATLTYGSGWIKPAVSASWAITALRVMAGTVRGETVTYDERAVSASLTLVPVTAVTISAVAGRALARTLHQRETGQSTALGGAWQTSLSAEVDF